MVMPGRKFSGGNGYRYGFNGKENDNEAKGEGNQYEYGFRIYDPRLGKFLSVDPLTKKYPELTPFQFASNNPVEGIDLDGLEYVTYKVRIEDGKVVSKVMTHDYRHLAENLLNAVHKGRLTFTRSINYGDRGDKPTTDTYTKSFYRVYSMGFGPLGRGVLYEYENVSKNSLVTVSSFFDKESTQAPVILSWAVGRVGVHGIYYGPGCPTVNGGEHDFKNNPYDYSLSPIDEVDGIARQHDMDYEEVYNKTGEYNGWKNDINTIEADKKMIAGWEDYLERATKKGFKDKYTGKAASEEAIKAAKQGVFYFKNIIIPHKERLKSAQERVKQVQEQQKKGRGVTTVRQ
jgi:RHS repeat-associated protein